jgi:Sigma-70 factor, region 1.1
MAGWKPIATAPREAGRPLLLHPRPRPVFEQPSDEPLLDLTSPAVRRTIKLAKKRGYISYDELNKVLGRLLDLAGPAVRRMIRLAKERGYITSNELNEILPSEEAASRLAISCSVLLGSFCDNVRVFREAVYGTVRQAISSRIDFAIQGQRTAFFCGPHS